MAHARPYKWIQKTGVKKPHHKGALHRALGYAQGEHIPTKVLLSHKHDTGHLGHMVRFALNVRGLRHHHGPVHRHHYHVRAHHAHLR